MHDGKKELLMNGYMPTNFSQGGVNFFQYENLPETEWGKNNMNGFIGWMGAGGSILQWDPELKIGFGYNPFTHNLLDLDGKRGARLQKVIKQCVLGTY